MTKKNKVILSLFCLSSALASSTFFISSTHASQNISFNEKIHNNDRNFNNNDLENSTKDVNPTDNVEVQNAEDDEKFPLPGTRLKYKHVKWIVGILQELRQNLIEKIPAYGNRHILSARTTEEITWLLITKGYVDILTPGSDNFLTLLTQVVDLINKFIANEKFQYKEIPTENDPEYLPSRRANPLVKNMFYVWNTLTDKQVDDYIEYFLQRMRGLFLAGFDPNTSSTWKSNDFGFDWYNNIPSLPTWEFATSIKQSDYKLLIDSLSSMEGDNQIVKSYFGMSYIKQAVEQQLKEQQKKDQEDLISERANFSFTDSTKNQLRKALNLPNDAQSKINWNDNSWNYNFSKLENLSFDWSKIQNPENRATNGENSNVGILGNLFIHNERLKLLEDFASTLELSELINRTGVGFNIFKNNAILENEIAYSKESIQLSDFMNSLNSVIEDDFKTNISSYLSIKKSSSQKSGLRLQKEDFQKEAKAQQISSVVNWDFDYEIVRDEKSQERNTGEDVYLKITSTLKTSDARSFDSAANYSAKSIFFIKFENLPSEIQNLIDNAPELQPNFVGDNLANFDAYQFIKDINSGKGTPFLRYSNKDSRIVYKPINLKDIGNGKAEITTQISPNIDYSKLIRNKLIKNKRYVTKVNTTLFDLSKNFLNKSHESAALTLGAFGSLLGKEFLDKNLDEITKKNVFEKSIEDLKKQDSFLKSNFEEKLKNFRNIYYDNLKNKIEDLRKNKDEFDKTIDKQMIIDHYNKLEKNLSDNLKSNSIDPSSAPVKELFDHIDKSKTMALNNQNPSTLAELQEFLARNNDLLKLLNTDTLNPQNLKKFESILQKFDLNQIKKYKSLGEQISLYTILGFLSLISLGTILLLVRSTRIGGSKVGLKKSIFVLLTSVASSSTIGLLIYIIMEAIGKV